MEGRGTAGASEADGEEDWAISLPPTPRERPSPILSPEVAGGPVSLPLTRLDLSPEVVTPPWGSWPSSSQRLLALEGLGCRLLLPPPAVPSTSVVAHRGSGELGTTIGISSWSQVRTWRIKTLLLGVRGTAGGDLDPRPKVQSSPAFPLTTVLLAPSRGTGDGNPPLCPIPVTLTCLCPILFSLNPFLSLSPSHAYL